MESKTSIRIQCFHCGEECTTEKIRLDEKMFCCEGCKMVFQLLNQSGLCDYYQLNEKPGTNQKNPQRKDKFAFLNDPKIARQLVTFQDTEQTHITFYLPQIHCSSCLFLLENLHKLNPEVISSKVNFPAKEASVIFNHKNVELQQIAELLSSIGYEPYISLQQLQKPRVPVNKDLIYRLGVAGFCFGNIMLLSFPEYLGLGEPEKSLQFVFRAFSLVLSMPVILYCSQPFYKSAYKSLKHRFLNIDAPIALAIIVTFARSAYEVLSGHGSGYLDSLSGIVFFMLAGRVLQDKTYQQLSFDRDYTSYFPVAVSVLSGRDEIQTALPDIKHGDTLLIHNEELIPADGILTRGKAFIDYSFVTGESLPVLKEMGEIIYAGGKQKGQAIEMLVIKEVAQSYLTKLWGDENSQKEHKGKAVSFVHFLSRWFTYIVLTIATLAAIYWWIYDPSRIGNAVTAVLIIACPCALLLSSTFTNGNILRILGRNNFYLRNAQTIEDIARVNHIVFDKTGTLTSSQQMKISYVGNRLSQKQEQLIAALASQSNHPLSKALVQHLHPNNSYRIQGYKEHPGSGIEGLVNGELICMGSKQFILGKPASERNATCVYVSLENQFIGHFVFNNRYRESLPALVEKLRPHYHLSVLSGDNAGERENLQTLLGKNATLLFNQDPSEKLLYIQNLQAMGDHVMMVGDGLNDAVALRQSDVGVAVADNSNNFTPASDAILDAGRFSMLYKYLSICKLNKKVIMTSFVLSILYNIIGLSFAVQGTLSPMIAAILMPSSSLSILLITFGISNLVARFWKL